jgi:hypothetical protein
MKNSVIFALCAGMLVVAGVVVAAKPRPQSYTVIWTQPTTQEVPCTESNAGPVLNGCVTQGRTGEGSTPEKSSPVKMASESSASNPASDSCRNCRVAECNAAFCVKYGCEKGSCRAEPSIQNYAEVNVDAEEADAPPVVLPPPEPVIPDGSWAQKVSGKWIVTPLPVAKAADTAPVAAPAPGVYYYSSDPSAAGSCSSASGSCGSSSGSGRVGLFGRRRR